MKKSKTLAKLDVKPMNETELRTLRGGQITTRSCSDTYVGRNGDSHNVDDQGGNHFVWFAC